LIKLDAREENRNTWLRGGGGADPTCRSTLPAAKAGGSLSHALAVGLELVGYVWVNQSKRGKKKTKSSSRHTIYTCKLLLLDQGGEGVRRQGIPGGCSWPAKDLLDLGTTWRSEGGGRAGEEELALAHLKSNPIGIVWIG
jgi:hypothetical protein